MNNSVYRSEEFESEKCKTCGKLCSNTVARQTHEQKNHMVNQ